MLILVDKKIPDGAKENLSKYGELLELSTSGITYEAISGHPDIFFFKSPDKLFVAPNLPNEYFEILNKYAVPFKKGSSPVEAKYPLSARYNAVADDNYFIHNLKITDQTILQELSDIKHLISVNQGYCRCSLLALKNNSFITSDSGIYKALLKENLNSLLVDTKQVLLPGFSHGFFGGACGIFENKIFLIGSLKYVQDAENIKKYTSYLNYEIIELYNGPLFDGGGIFFI
ncbi:MAG: DUF6873 family GME fold protein [Bacillota bacterium]